MYEKRIQEYLTEGGPTLYSYLCHYFSHFQYLAKAEPNIPQLNWNVGETVLSIDGHPIIIDRYVQSIKDLLQNCRDQVAELFGSCPYQDIEAIIRRHTDPSDTDNWFRENPRNEDAGYSFIGENLHVFVNEEQDMTQRLLQHVCGKMFELINGSLVPHIHHIRKFFEQLDALVDMLFLLSYFTWGGCPRGTEMEVLMYRNTPHSLRNLYFLNGIICTAFRYGKMSHRQGHSTLIMRTPAYDVGVLILLTIVAIYPTAAHLARYLEDPSKANNYLSFLFVKTGKVMNSDAFSKSLGHFMSQHHGKRLTLRPMRQVQTCLSIYFTHTDFSVPDAEDEEISRVHQMFGHSTAVGLKHYGVTYCDSLESISASTVRSHQRVSLLLHEHLGMSHPNQAKLQVRL